MTCDCEAHCEHCECEQRNVPASIVAAKVWYKKLTFWFSLVIFLTSTFFFIYGIRISDGIRGGQLIVVSAVFATISALVVYCSFIFTGYCSLCGAFTTNGDTHCAVCGSSFHNSPAE